MVTVVLDFDSLSTSFSSTCDKFLIESFLVEIRLYKLICFLPKKRKLFKLVHFVFYIQENKIYKKKNNDCKIFNKGASFFQILKELLIFRELTLVSVSTLGGNDLHNRAEIVLNV